MKENPMLRQLKEQLQINLLQVFEDVSIGDEQGNYSNSVRDAVLDHMCTVIINTVNEAPGYENN